MLIEHRKVVGSRTRILGERIASHYGRSLKFWRHLRYVADLDSFREKMFHRAVTSSDSVG